MIEGMEYPEGATPLTGDEAEGLLLPHITTRGELDTWEQLGILKATRWAMRRRPSNILSGDFIRDLHRRCFSEVWRWAGTHRYTQKTVGVEAYKITGEVRNLCEDAQCWIEHGTFPPDEIAARIHHRLVAIHCFPNGNGRHARLMADLVLAHLLDQPRFTWGGQSLSRQDDCRRRYITALKTADLNDYGPLLDFVRS